MFADLDQTTLRAIICSFIEQGKLDDSLQDMSDAIRARHITRTAMKKSALSNGDYVRIARAKPKYLNGIVGAVIGKDEKYVHLCPRPQFQRQCGKYLQRDGSIRVPASLLDPITTHQVLALGAAS